MITTTSRVAPPGNGSSNLCRGGKDTWQIPSRACRTRKWHTKLKTKTKTRGMDVWKRSRTPPPCDSAFRIQPAVPYLQSRRSVNSQLFGSYRTLAVDNRIWVVQWRTRNVYAPRHRLRRCLPPRSPPCRVSRATAAPVASLADPEMAPLELPVLILSHYDPPLPFCAS
jgi:hypothetical protein